MAIKESLHGDDFYDFERGERELARSALAPYVGEGAFRLAVFGEGLPSANYKTLPQSVLGVIPEIDDRKLDTI